MKWLGEGIVFLAFLSFGIQRVRDRKRHIQCLSDMTEALRLFAAELQSNRTPMKELLEWMALQAAGEASLFFQSLSKNFSRLGAESFYALWQEAAVNCLRSMNTAELRDMAFLGKMLGRAELSKQLSALDGCVRSLRARLEWEETRFQEEKKLSLGVPAALGFLVCILLL